MDTSSFFLRLPDEEERQSSWDLVYHRSPTPSPVDFLDNQELVYNPYFRAESIGSEVEVMDISTSPETLLAEIIEIFSSPEVEILPTPQKAPPETIDLVSSPDTSPRNLRVEKRKNVDEPLHCPPGKKKKISILFTSDEEDSCSELEDFLNASLEMSPRTIDLVSPNSVYRTPDRQSVRRRLVYSSDEDDSPGRLVICT